MRLRPGVVDAALPVDAQLREDVCRIVLADVCDLDPRPGGAEVGRDGQVERVGRTRLDARDDRRRADEGDVDVVRVVDIGDRRTGIIEEGVGGVGAGCRQVVWCLRPSSDRGRAGRDRAGIAGRGREGRGRSVAVVGADLSLERRGGLSREVDEADVDVPARRRGIAGNELIDATQLRSSTAPGVVPQACGPGVKVSPKSLETFRVTQSAGRSVKKTLCEICPTAM